MNIGIDFDDTITVNPVFFRKFTTDLSKHGNSIYIISSCDRKSEPLFNQMLADKKRKLKGWGVTYRGLKLVKEPIPRGKAAFCERHNISVMIDNDLKNLKAIKRLEKNILCLQVI